MFRKYTGMCLKILIIKIDVLLSVKKINKKTRTHFDLVNKNTQKETSLPLTLVTF